MGVRELQWVSREVVAINVGSPTAGNDLFLGEIHAREGMVAAETALRVLQLVSDGVGSLPVVGVDESVGRMCRPEHLDRVTIVPKPRVVGDPRRKKGRGREAVLRPESIEPLRHGFGELRQVLVRCHSNCFSFRSGAGDHNKGLWSGYS